MLVLVETMCALNRQEHGPHANRPLAQQENFSGRNFKTLLESQ